MWGDELMSVKPVALVAVVTLGVYGLVNDAGAQTRTPAFAPGELIVGYGSQNDRDQALKELNSSKDNVSVRGERAGNVEYQAVGGRSLKLRMDLPVRMRGQTDQQPGLELQVLKETAEQLKARDKRIKYAHPNWILGINPVPPREPIDVTSLDKMLFTSSIGSGGPNDYAYVRGLHWHYAAPPMGMNAIGAWNTETGSKDIVPVLAIPTTR